MDLCAERTNRRLRQQGAALAVALTLVAAIMLLAMTVVRETTVDTAMTQHFVAHISAWVASASALETTLANSQALGQTAFDRSYRFGPDGQFETSVAIRYLGMVETGGTETEGSAHRYYEIVVAAIGPRNARHRRIQYLRTPTASGRQ
jgi:hypothetical protein